MNRFLKYQTKIALYFIIILYIFISSPPIFASDPSFTISPVTLEFTLKPGTIHKINFEITNTSADRLSLNIVPSFFKPVDEFGNIEFNKNDKNLSNWLANNDYLPQVMILEKSEIKDFSPTISIPQNVQSGDYYLAFTFESTAKDTTKTRFKINQKLAISCLIFLEIKDKPQPLKISLEEFSISPRIITASPAIFTLRLKNEGRARIKIAGEINITDLIGRKIIDIPIPKQTILSNSIRSLSGPQNKLAWQTSSLGIYTVNFNLREITDSKSLISGKSYLISFPFGYLVAFCLVLLIIIIVFLRKK